MRERLSTYFALLVGIVSVLLALIFAAMQSGLV